jgi:hypothetical protein
MLSTKNLTRILDKIQSAAVPPAFGIDFLKDLGFTSSNDRGILKVLKYLGMLDASGKPLPPYFEFVDKTRSKTVLARCLQTAFDDLFTSNRSAQELDGAALRGWFKTKTGVGDSVAQKMATMFKVLADYGDWKSAPAAPNPGHGAAKGASSAPRTDPVATGERPDRRSEGTSGGLALVYRLEVHLPDTQNVETFRAIFRAIREELA